MIDDPSQSEDESQAQGVLNRFHSERPGGGRLEFEAWAAGRMEFEGDPDLLERVRRHLHARIRSGGLPAQVLRAGENSFFRPAGALPRGEGSSLFVHELGSDLTCDEKLPALGRMRTPTVSPAGLAITASWRGVAAIDLHGSHFLWHRPLVDGERELVQAPQGWSTLVGTSEDLTGLELRLPDDHYPRPLLDSSVELLLDPKRVRAARAGIPLSPAST